MFGCFCQREDECVCVAIENMMLLLLSSLSSSSSCVLYYISTKQKKQNMRESRAREKESFIANKMRNSHEIVKNTEWNSRYPHTHKHILTRLESIQFMEREREIGACVKQDGDNMRHMHLIDLHLLNTFARSISFSPSCSRYICVTETKTWAQHTDTKWDTAQ